MFVAEDMWVIPSTAVHKQAAWQFLDWIEQPSVYGPIANKMVNLPQFKSLYSDTSWAGPALKINVELQKGYDTIASPNFPGFVQYYNLISNAEQQAANLKMSPEAALAQIKSEMGQQRGDTWRASLWRSLPPSGVRRPPHARLRRWSKCPVEAPPPREGKSQSLN